MGRAPTREASLGSEFRLLSGSIWHEQVADKLLLQKILRVEEEDWVLNLEDVEVDLTEGLPEGWTGTADWLFWNGDFNAYVIGDLKTIKGEGMRYIYANGAKAEHMAQVSAYVHALASFPDVGSDQVMGKFLIVYLPISDAPDLDVHPTVEVCVSMDKDALWTMMENKWQATSDWKLEWFETGNVVNDRLAPPMERVQKAYWNTSRNVYELKLVPHWTTQFCLYDEPYCDCRDQGTTKIGEFDLDGAYTPRSGYEGIEAEVRVSDLELNKRRSAA